MKGKLICDSSRIVKYLQNRVRLQEAVTKCSHVIISGAGDSIVEEDLLGGLCFTCAALTRYENALVLPLGPHGSVGVVRQGIAEGKHNSNFNSRST